MLVRMLVSEPRGVMGAPPDEHVEAADDSTDDGAHRNHCRASGGAACAFNSAHTLVVTMAFAAASKYCDEGEPS